MLEWKDVRSQYVVDKEHARRKLPHEENRPSCYISGYNANHLTRRGVWPQPVISQVSWGSKEMECGYNIGGLYCPLTAINREVDNSRTRYSHGCHGMEELNDHPGVEELAQSHKSLQGVPLHTPHGIPELGICSKSLHIIIYLVVYLFSIAI